MPGCADAAGMSFFRSLVVILPRVRAQRATSGGGLERFDVLVDPGSSQ